GGTQASARLGNNPLHRLTNRLRIVNIFLDYRVLRQWLNCIAFHSVATVVITELNQLHRSGADIDAQQRIRFFSKQSQHGKTLSALHSYRKLLVLYFNRQLSRGLQLANTSVNKGLIMVCSSGQYFSSPRAHFGRELPTTVSYTKTEL